MGRRDDRLARPDDPKPPGPKEYVDDAEEALCAVVIALEAAEQAWLDTGGPSNCPTFESLDWHRLDGMRLLSSLRRRFTDYDWSNPARGNGADEEPF